MDNKYKELKLGDKIRKIKDLIKKYDNPCFLNLTEYSMWAIIQTYLKKNNGDIKSTMTMLFEIWETVGMKPEYVSFVIDSIISAETLRNIDFSIADKIANYSLDKRNELTKKNIRTMKRYMKARERYISILSELKSEFNKDE